MFPNFRLRWRQLATRTWAHSGSFPFLLDRMRALQEAWEKFESEKADFERWMLKGGQSTTSQSMKDKIISFYLKSQEEELTDKSVLLEIACSQLLGRLCRSRTTRIMDP
jgi:hypothetical protein